ncbi:MAG: glycosyltransferase family 2 protein [Vicingaceae bacterium]
MSKSVKLSVVIITRNEERNIRRCLESIKRIADDITVIDSLSTDRTVEICREMGATVYSQEFLGHVEQKNFAITKAKYPHILSLDADEALDETLKKEVQKIKENWSQDGYSMNRLTNYCGKWIYHCGWYPDKKLRLWDSAKGKWEGINPHDEFRLEKGAAASHLAGNILHYSYHSISDHIKQVNYFTDISAKANLMKGKRGSLLQILFSPLVKFFRDYVFKLGFLDGYYGLVICMISSHATFLKYIKMRQFRENDFTDAYTS